MPQFAGERKNQTRKEKKGGWPKALRRLLRKIHSLQAELARARGPLVRPLGKGQAAGEAQTLEIRRLIGNMGQSSKPFEDLLLYGEKAVPYVLEAMKGLPPPPRAEALCRFLLKDFKGPSSLSSGFP